MVGEWPLCDKGVASGPGRHMSAWQLGEGWFSLFNGR